MNVLHSNGGPNETRFEVASGMLLINEPLGALNPERAIRAPARNGIWSVEVGLYTQGGGCELVSSLTASHEEDFWGGGELTRVALGEVSVDGGTFGVFDALHYDHERGVADTLDGARIAVSPHGFAAETGAATASFRFLVSSAAVRWWPCARSSSTRPTAGERPEEESDRLLANGEVVHAGHTRDLPRDYCAADQRGAAAAGFVDLE